jgi:SHAQKYF class myb-like DNA-binding protein
MSSEDSRPTHGFNVSQSPPIASPAEDSSSDSRQALISNPATNVSSPAATSGSKPKLKVVEIGQEHTGRWTREEHESFLLALQNHGKEWKKVAAKVKTRTVVQTRTHAQKYFQKLQKGLVSNEIDGLEIGTADEAKKILPIASARRGQEPVSGEFVKKVRKKQDRSLLATAMSAQKRHAAAATQAAAQLMTQISQINTTNEDQSMLNAAAIAGVDQQMYSAQTGFSQGAPPASTGMFSAGTSFAAPTGLPSSQMKIIAPQPEHTMKKNKFPEPSPAACGKRKVAELAVAQMLAGVAASGKLLSPSLPRKIARASTPSSDVNGHDHVASVGSARASGSLQIINPETLKSSESTKKRNLGQEPVTPWDGQLEALNR